MYPFDTVDSTNAVARRLLRADGLVLPAGITAREQTCGRGSHGRRWHSPRDAGVYLSVVQSAPHPTIPCPELLTRSAGVACVSVLTQQTGLPICIKSPNDLLLHGSKVGGILCEALAETGSPPALIIGIGINLRRAHRPVGSGGIPATALEDHLRPPLPAGLQQDALVDALAAAVIHWVHSALHDSDDVTRQWRCHLCTDL